MILTYGRGKPPVAKLEAIHPAGKKRLSASRYPRSLWSNISPTFLSHKRCVLGKLPGAEALEREFLNIMDDAGYTLLPIDAGSALRAGPRH